MNSNPVYEILRHIYTACIIIGMPFLRMHQRKRIELGKEDPLRILERQGITVRAKPTGRVIWFHGASVGEAVATLPVIEGILKTDKEVSIVITTGTTSSASILAQRLPERACHQYTPLDLPQWIDAFLDHWNPESVVWMESEFWPNMLYKIRQRNIPLTLLNGRVSNRSFKRWKKIKFIIKPILSCFTQCLAQSDEDAHRLIMLGANNVTNHGNLKLCAPKLPVSESDLTVLTSKIQDRKCWLLSSTHAGEEEIAIRVHKKLRDDFPDILTIIVPRHPDRGTSIRNLISAEGSDVALRSAQEFPDEKTQVYVADTVGELGIFYELCDIVFMGKSLIQPGGGQNPYEPAKFGNAVIFGPHMNNFTTLSKGMLQENAAICAKDPDDLYKIVHQLLKNSDNMKALQEKASSFCESAENIIEESVKKITFY